MKRLYHARILSPDCTCFDEGELWIDQSGAIAFSGVPTEEEKRDTHFSEERDLQGDYVIPGFKNAHAHSAMTFLRGRAENTALWPWLSTQIFPREEKLTDEDIYWFARLAILEYLSGGTTACFDMYFHANAFYQACIDSGFRAVLCGSAAAADDKPLEKLADLYETYREKHPLFNVKLGFHAEYTADLDLLDGIARLSDTYKAGVFMHSSETKNEVKNCLEKYGKTPTELFYERGLFSNGGGAFHNVYLTEHDLELIKETGITLVTCPASNLKLSSGIAAVSEWSRRGIPFAVGTDGAASNNALSMFREIYLCTVLQKARTFDPAALKATEVLKAAVSTGASMMGFSDCGSLEKGMQADLVILDRLSPGLNPVISPVENLVYAADRAAVKETMIAGKTLYQDGAYFVGEDVKTIYAETEKRAKRIESEL